MAVGVLGSLCSALVGNCCLATFSPHANLNQRIAFPSKAVSGPSETGHGVGSTRAFQRYVIDFSYCCDHLSNKKQLEGWFTVQGIQSTTSGWQGSEAENCLLTSQQTRKHPNRNGVCPFSLIKSGSQATFMMGVIHHHINPDNSHRRASLRPKYILVNPADCQNHLHNWVLRMKSLQ